MIGSSQIKVLPIKFLAAVVLVASISVLGWWFWSLGLHRLNLIPRNKIEYYFYKEIEQAKISDTIADLSQMYADDWDELIFWGPYESICDLGISSFEKGSDNCAESHDDGDCHLLFLKENKIISKARVNRRTIDWAISKLPKKISRQDFKIKIEKNTDWPKVTLAN